jgi:hypothetical protein
MERTRWPIAYKNVRRDILLGLIAMPKYPGQADCVVGNSTSNRQPGILSSSWQDERKIECLMPLIDRVLDRCEETV